MCKKTSHPSYPYLLFFRHAVTCKRKMLRTTVMLGVGKFSVAQAAFTDASHPLSLAARSVRFFAPLLVVEPWQLSAAELPPPDLSKSSILISLRLKVAPYNRNISFSIYVEERKSHLMIRWAVAAKMPFFPFFLPPVLLAALILPCCFMKFATWVFIRPR